MHNTPNFTTRNKLRALALITAALILAPATTAQQQPTRSPRQFLPEPSRLNLMVQQLASDNFPQRERAWNALQSLRVHPQELLKALDSTHSLDSLTIEQATRLDAVLLARFSATPRAGLGAGLQIPPDHSPGILITSIVPNFPASKFLLVNDIILEADNLNIGHDIEANTIIRAIIISHDPGDLVPFRILRNNQTINLTIPLGSFSDLGNGAKNPPRQMLLPAWTLLRERLGFTLPAQRRAVTVITAAEWPKAKPQSLTDESQTPIVPGGRFTIANSPAATLRTARNPGITRLESQQVLRRAPAVEQKNRLNRLGNRREQIEAIVRDKTNSMQVLKGLLNNPTLSQARAAKTRVQIKQIEKDISRLQALLPQDDNDDGSK